MISKTLGTILIVIICLMVFPIGIAVLGGVFGIVVGVFGAVFGAFAGIIGGFFGAIFGVFGWIFDGLFNWHWPFNFHCDLFTIGLIAIVVALIVRSKSGRR